MSAALYFPVISDPAQAHKVDRAMVALHRINANFQPPSQGWMLDSGGYHQLTKRGPYEEDEIEYVREVMRLEKEVGGLSCAFHQDIPLTPDVMEALGQEPCYDAYFASRAKSLGKAKKTIRAADNLGCSVPIAPVLQGRSIREYVEEIRNLRHIREKVEIIGIGSLKAPKQDCKADRPTPEWLRVLTLRLREIFPEAKLHALGVGKRYVNDRIAGRILQEELYSFDTAAWSMAARWGAGWSTGDNHDVTNARRYGDHLQKNAPLFSRQQTAP